MLVLFDLDFSVEAREAEEAAVVHWNEFLPEVEKGMASKLPILGVNILL